MKKYIITMVILGINSAEAMTLKEKLDQRLDARYLQYPTVSLPNTLEPAASDKDASKNKKQKFTAEEDARLIGLFQKHGPEWGEIAKFMPGRNTRQCRERYLNYLAPNLNQNPWSATEDQTLLDAVNKHGTKWALIQQNHFSNRTQVNIKNRYGVLTYKSKRNAKKFSSMINQTAAVPTPVNVTANTLGNNMPNNPVHVSSDSSSDSDFFVGFDD